MSIVYEIYCLILQRLRDSGQPTYVAQTKTSITEVTIVRVQFRTRSRINFMKPSQATSTGEARRATEIQV
jgi:hypothetical protein